MNPVIQKIIESKVFDRLTEVSEPEYYANVERFGRDAFFNYGTVAFDGRFFIYKVKAPPDWRMLEKIIKDKNGYSRTT